ncbi:peptidase domain-containing ABC transporter [Synechocystis sp. PCC 7339]|uniref:peptidase domain-containing ABC transporter n=1 Tax=Synechocystis sp. PCC 7339 TaxID=2782213 RepID=UPI001CBB2EE9|nr:peptidase domain-containing ABC transporter [Synechocystis sp. PCC 7339]UAJ73533.1 peptidase domain-containing ABC transporter [Synechocystis sp. PCC 7339]
MSLTIADYQSFLQEIEPFAQLPAPAIAEIAAKLRPLRFRMGQIILARGKLANNVYFLVSGQARLLGYDPGTGYPATMALLQNGAVIGDNNAIRNVPCETAIASTETICASLTRDEFLALVDKYPELTRVYRHQCGRVELFDLLGEQLQRTAQGNVDLRQLTLEMLPHSQVHQLEPGSHNLPSNLPDPEKFWLVSSGELEQCPRGSALPASDSPLLLKAQTPVRLIGIPPLPRFYPGGSGQKSNGSGNGHGEVPLATVTPLAPEDSPWDDIPYADPNQLGEPLPEPTVVKSGRKNYPIVRGQNPTDAGVACFQMISQYFGMPFRRDIIQRIVTEEIKRSEALSLPICGAIIELMGLTSQLVRIPTGVFGQMQVPFLIRWQDSLALVYEVGDREVKIAVPELGLVKRNTSEFLETWGEEGQGEVLMMHPSKDTPQQRFGLSWFWPALVKYRHILLLVFVASFFVQLFGLANPLMIQIIIDKVIVQNSKDTLQVLGIALVSIAIFEALLSTLRTYLFVDTTNRIDMSLGSEIIDHLLRLPLRYFENRPVGEISTRVNELENIRQFLTGTALTVVLDSVFSVVYIVVMIIYSPLLTAVALGIVPIFVVLTLVFSPLIRRQLRLKAERNAQTQSYLVEVMSGIQTVKAQNIELRSRWQWQDKYSRYVGAGFNTVITSTLASSSSHFLNQLSGLLVLWVGASLVLDGDLTLGQLIAFRIIAGYVTSPILRLTQLWQNFQETALSLERLADIVDTPQESERDRQNIPMPEIAGEVKFENVSFRFKKQGPLQLNNINLSFAPGTFVALVGQSGAGKSTLTKLLSRLYEPEGGRILVDGLDIGKVELYSLRRQVGVVPQETLLFEGTVQENIALTNPDASTEQIIAAAKVASAHDFIMTLPNGYNTRVGERGATLSGGQRQRIAIARSVLQRPRILVLDEATSALDYITEQQVCINLGDAFREHTVFFITHRLSSVRSADVIVMMDQGSVVEQGSHEELMALKGRYYYLYQQQGAGSDDV